MQLFSTTWKAFDGPVSILWAFRFGLASSMDGWVIITLKFCSLTIMTLTNSFLQLPVFLQRLMENATTPQAQVRLSYRIYAHVTLVWSVSEYYANSSDNRLWEAAKSTGLHLPRVADGKWLDLHSVSRTFRTAISMPLLGDTDPLSGYTWGSTLDLPVRITVTLQHFELNSYTL